MRTRRVRNVHRRRHVSCVAARPTCDCLHSARQCSTRTSAFGSTGTGHVHGRVCSSRSRARSFVETSSHAPSAVERLSTGFQCARSRMWRRRVRDARCIAVALGHARMASVWISASSSLPRSFVVSSCGAVGSALLWWRRRRPPLHAFFCGLRRCAARHWVVRGQQDSGSVVAILVRSWVRGARRCVRGTDGVPQSDARRPRVVSNGVGSLLSSFGARMHAHCWLESCFGNEALGVLCTSGSVPRGYVVLRQLRCAMGRPRSLRRRGDRGTAPSVADWRRRGERVGDQYLVRAPWDVSTGHHAFSVSSQTASPASSSASSATGRDVATRAHHQWGRGGRNHAGLRRVSLGEPAACSWTRAGHRFARALGGTRRIVSSSSSRSSSRPSSRAGGTVSGAPTVGASCSCRSSCECSGGSARRGRPGSGPSGACHMIFIA